MCLQPGIMQVIGHGVFVKQIDLADGVDVLQIMKGVTAGDQEREYLTDRNRPVILRATLF